MEAIVACVTQANVITAGVAVLMLRYLKKLIAADVGDNRGWYAMVFVALGLSLYLWRSGTAQEMILQLQNALQSV